MAKIKKKKSLGQHFLKDPEVSRLTAEAIDNEQATALVEIGPGEGALTEYLIQKWEKPFFLVEKDDRLIERLSQKFNQENLSIIHQDVLKLNWTDAFPKPYIVAGNYPYYISNLILFKVFEHRDEIVQMVGMFQKEVADRVCSPNKSKSYGKLTVLLQAFYDAEMIVEIPPESFDPPPKVDSAVIRLNRKKTDPNILDVKCFVQTVKLIFGQRRKKISNSLKSLIPEYPDSIKAFLDKRPEQLTVEDFIDLSNKISVSSEWKERS